MGNTIVRSNFSPVVTDEAQTSFVIPLPVAGLCQGSNSAVCHPFPAFLLGKGQEASGLGGVQLSFLSHGVLCVAWEPLKGL